MEGWIKLHRQLLEWEWYDEPNTFRLFMHCLLKANHKDKMYRGQLVKAGSFLTSRDTLASETGLTTQQVRTSLKRLESTNEITTKKSKKGTVLQIVKYVTYQHDNQKINQQINQQLTNNQPTANQQLTTNKNDNNDKNEKNEKKLGDIKQNYKPEFNSFFSKVKTRFHQDWITEVFNDYKSFSPNCEKTIQEFIDGTMKYSILEFCKSCKYASIKFFNETAAINYWKQASKGYVSDIDVWRDKLKAMKKRSEEQLASLNS